MLPPTAICNAGGTPLSFYPLSYMGDDLWGVGGVLDGKTSGIGAEILYSM